jgi:hypothetical protein
MSNDFLPFAVGGSANVTPQATYAADTAILQNGFATGIAKSADLNKVWRQSSIMSAVVSQFITNTTGQNAVDDGTTATLIANLAAAVSAQSESIIGGVRNLVMTVATASATATVTADEIIVGSALGGLKYTLASFSKTINLATTGAGGMDTGTAPASGFVALYAIFNPATATAALLATNAATLQGNVYGGANMPAGFTASALVSVVPTNASSLIVPCTVQDRSVDMASVTALSTNTVAASPTLVNNTVVPLNAKTCTGTISAANTGASTVTLTVFSTINSTAPQSTAVALSSAGSISLPLTRLKLTVPQRMFYSATSTAGTPTFTVVVNSYEI